MRQDDWASEIPEFAERPTRVVSLVPSATESLFALGLGDGVIAVTDYCRPPSPSDQSLHRVGGPKSVQVSTVIDLGPDLVIANREENSRQDIQALHQAGLCVWVTFPCTTSEATQDLRSLIRMLSAWEAEPSVEHLERVLDWTRDSCLQQPAVRVFCPIWEGKLGDDVWWMTFAAGTYAHDVLATCGGENVFAYRRRRYPVEADLGMAAPQDPGERDTRYPRVRPGEVVEMQPEIILLPDEPYRFGGAELQRFRDMLRETPAVKNERLHLIDGKLLFWHGTFLARTLQEVPSLLRLD